MERKWTPKRFLVDGNTITKQTDLANAQAKYYSDKVVNIKNNLPKVRTDPLYYLKLAYEQWIPTGRIPEFVKESDLT